jgi:hypothetical protein
MAYQCQVCKLKYADEQTAKECEAWCSTRQSCNFLIARQAINKVEAKDMPISDDERFKL